MRQPLLFIFALALLTGCGSRTPQTALSGVSGSTDSVTTPSEVSANETTEPTTDEVVCKAIADYLGGDKSAVRFTEQAKRDLYESTWPEVQCSVEGLLDSPSSFKDLVVKRVGSGLYKYECVCPDHGDRYVDCCTLSANVASDGVVEIEAVTWDNAVESFAALLDKAKWTKTEFNFKVPDLMTPSSEIWVDDVPASVNRWDYEDVCLAC